MFQRKDNIENNIHIVWMGSELREKHLQRIIQWKKLNSKYEIIIWIEPQFEAVITKQLEEQNIRIKLLSSLDISKNVEQIINKFIEPREDKSTANYAAACDLYRFIILKKCGGWYSDIDIEPIDVSKIKINKNLNFHINSSRLDDTIKQLSPSLIASYSKSALMTVSEKMIAAFCREFNEKQLSLVRSPFASRRMLSTHTTTGYILRACLGKIIVNGFPIIEVQNDFDNTTRIPEVFDSISSEFINNFEQSWIIDRINNKIVFPIKGITLDDDYVHLLSGKLDQPWIYYELAPVFYAKQLFFGKVEKENLDVEFLHDHKKSLTAAPGKGEYSIELTRIFSGFFSQSKKAMKHTMSLISEYAEEPSNKKNYLN